MKFDHASKPFSATIAAFGSIVSAGVLGQPTGPRVLLGLVASNKCACINACLNLPQRHYLAWQPCDDS